MRTYKLFTFWAPALLLGAGLLTLASLPVRADSLTTFSSVDAHIFDHYLGHYVGISGPNCTTGEGASACAYLGSESHVEVDVDGLDLETTATAFEAFKINGPEATAVPLIITGNWDYSVPSGEPGTIFGAVTVGLVNNDCCDENVLSLSTSSATTGIFSKNFYWQAGDLSQMVTEVECEIPRAASGIQPDPDCSVLIDPTITIDPTFLANNPGYSLEEYIPPSPTPEPSSWALLLTGALLLGLMLWRRRAMPSKLFISWAPALLLGAGLLTVAGTPARADSLTNISAGGGSVWDAATGHYAAQSGLDSNCAFASNASACGWAGIDSIVEVSSQEHDLFPSALASEAFQINGPVFNQAVPMIITGSWTWSEPAAEDSSPPAGFGAVLVELFNNTCCNQTLFTLTSNNAHSGFFSTHFTWYAGFTSIILTTAGCGVGSSGAGAQENPNCTVDIDPAITIDPSFLTNNPGYSLAEGMPPLLPSPTPEPSTWVLLLTGALLFAAIHLYSAHAKRAPWKGENS